MQSKIFTWDTILNCNRSHSRKCYIGGSYHRLRTETKVETETEKASIHLIDYFGIGRLNAKKLASIRVRSSLLAGSMYFVYLPEAYAARASAAPSFLIVLAAMTRRTLTATLTRPETGAPPPTIA